jgi:carboxymethylenebutenolidase
MSHVEKQLTLTASDGHQLAAFHAKPAGTPRGAIVVVQEIFGVNDHIRRVTTGFAEEGFVAVAPALFDRVERNVELGYDPPGFERGRALVGQIDYADVMRDVDAAVAHLSAHGKVGVVGYCYGGAVVWLAAARLASIACAVSYYGSRIPQLIDESPRVPLIMHVGNEDASFPMEKVAEIGQRHPAVTIHVYDADHGFNCDARGSYDAAAAATALERTHAFFDANLA